MFAKAHGKYFANVVPTEVSDGARNEHCESQPLRPLRGSFPPCGSADLKQAWFCSRSLRRFAWGGFGLHTITPQNYKK